MKNIRKIIATVTCAAISVVALFGLSACDGEKEIVNAYDIAVKNGFEGTEAEWLQSLYGADGADGESLNVYDLYQAAKDSEEGYEGTLLDFIKEYLRDTDLSVQENNDTAVIARNISSVVSVYCAFTEKPTTWYQSQGTKVSGAGGSGVIIDYGFNKNAGTAYIVTNYHVIYNSASTTENGISDCIYVYPYGALNYFTSGDKTGDGYLDDVNGDGLKNADDQGDQGGEGIRARFIGGAMDYDIAVLKVEGSEYLSESAATAASFGDSGNVTVGEKAYAIGNSNGQGISVTSGVVSVESEYIKMSALDGRDLNGDRKVDSVTFRVMRTDAAINHGNSGGGLFNARGELIGITNAKNVEDETDNMGYALPATPVKYLVYNILDNVSSGVGSYATRAMLGVEMATVSTQTSFDAAGKLVLTENVAISKVGEDCAAKNKLKIGDAIKKMTLKDPDGGSKLKTFEISRKYEISDLLLTVRKGDTVVFTVSSDGIEKPVAITFDKDGYFIKYA